jgi:glycosyltransferase involved in cell wall biosynthesis
LISVIVVYFNRPKSINKTVECILNQTVPPHELIVVDDCSPTKLNLKSNGILKVIRNDKELGISGARNVAIKAATGDCILFTDDDVSPEPNWVESVTKEFDNGADVVGGEIHPNYQTSIPKWWTAKDYGTTVSIGNGPAEGIWAINMAVRKQVFLDVGLFNENIGRQKGTLLGEEETELLDRITATKKYKIVFCHASKVRHIVESRRLTLRYMLRWQFYAGVTKRLRYGYGFQKTVKTLLLSSFFFLKYSFKRNKLETIRHLCAMVLCFGRIFG